LMCHLGVDPQIKISKSGRPYSRLSVATHRTWKGEDDKIVKETDWHSVFVWGPLAEQCCHNLHKGSLVFVEGSLNYWKVAEESDDAKKYMNAIQAQTVNFLSFSKTPENASVSENLDNPAEPRNHNAVAHPA
jgi:single-strand DNA-binding protein